MRVIGYCRVSTETQAKDGYGIETQVSSIKKYCEDNKIELVDIFKDEGISGTYDYLSKRNGLTEILSTASKDIHVLVLNTSRLWRDSSAKFIIHKELKKVNSDVISIEQSNYSIYTKDPNDFLYNSLLELFDEYDRLNINMKLSKGRKTKAKSGEKACGTAPVGYKWVNAKIEIDEEWSPVVEEIFKKFLFYRSTGKVEQELKREGYKTPRGKNFSRAAIINILTNDFYFGVVTHDGKKIEGNHQAIIGRNRWYRVQNIIKSNKRTSQNEEKVE